MGFGWFDLNWPWIGLGLSVILLLLLISTSIFRSDQSISRWRDPVWLAWLAPAAYMLHQTEEYGRDAEGTFFAFPNLLCTTFGFPPYPNCPVPELVFVAINIPMVWIAGLACALLARRSPTVGLGLYGIFIANAFSHIGSLVAFGLYNSGVLTAFLIQAPMFVWIAYVSLRDRRIGAYGLLGITAGGIVTHIILFGSLVAFSRGLIGGDLLVGIQFANPLWLLFMPWLGQRLTHNRRSLNS